ncbi:Uncharacterised protein [Mycobacterium tuberculosis]|uniref:Uncharacterized protein n=1 Tax=Mycobacterium tuberculosis TaxID=1773 RepID=A0A655A8G5_MYCTX|nr:Uncharacterised protein [Mycobacterium tuberculosis]CKS07812.1 Uncharacterised protein [Mycobacterium tuberculosis]CKS24313.1 Uncharacterised protein [Mycobacterium tuberculosis]CKS66082.1 Uncharacterised protein [Mycobacterium tuberculosis]CKT70691.1 Uncharacterised protein [Mycobacterium tuberculosis]
MGATWLLPEATNTPSKRPYRPSAASTICWASARLSGRQVTTAASSMPAPLTSSARPAELPPASVSRAPASASARAATRPNEPVAPVIRIDLSCTLKRARPRFGTC